MILIMMAAGIAMNLLVGEAPLDGWALVSPLLFIALPWMAIVAALVVLLTIGWLRGISIVYFFTFMMLSFPLQTRLPASLDFAEWVWLAMAFPALPSGI
jgi:hypothetical protein